MNNLVGYKNFDVLYFLNSISIRSEFLYFDKIYFDTDFFNLVKIQAELFSRLLGSRNWYNLKIKEIEFLIKKGVLVEYKPDPIASLKSYKNSLLNLGYDELSKELNDTSEKFAIKKLDFDKYFFNKRIDKIQELFQLSIDIVKDFILLSDLASRIECIKNKVSSKNDFVPILQHTHFNIDYNENRNLPIVNTVIKNFPTISCNVPWEKIEELRNDDKFKRDFLALRNWMIEISLQPLSFNELNEKLQYLLLEYEHNLKRKKIEYKKTFFSNFISFAVNCFNAFISKDFTTLPDSLFELTNTKKAFLEVEYGSPGREVAYLSGLHSKFPDYIENLKVRSSTD